MHKTAISSSITNELAFFSQSAGWDIAARQVAANGRQIGEILARRMLIELLRATDAHESVAVSGEDVSGQLTGTGSLIKSANFPIAVSYTHLGRNSRDSASESICQIQTIS